MAAHFAAKATNWPRCARWLLAVVAAGAILTACSSQQVSEQPPTVTVQVATAQLRSIQQIVTSDATLYPRNQAAVVPQITAPIKKFYVDRGSHVHAGELLAELESQTQQGAYAENRGGYQQAQADYDTALQNARQQLMLAKQQLDAAQNLYNNRENLLQQGAVSKKDVEDARIALTQAQNQYDLAQKQFDVKAAQGQLNAAKGRVVSAQAELNYTRITSPISGVITDRPYYVGETVSSGQPILTVMDLSEIIARAYVPEDLAASLKVGDPATIETAGLNKLLNGKVTLVSPALDPNTTNLEVWVAAPNPGEKLKPGTGVRVTIVAQTVPQAMVVPVDALLTASDGSTSVMVLTADSKARQENVTVGIRSGDDAQVTNGLKAGDRVVTTGAYELSTEDPAVLAKTMLQIASPGPSGSGSNE
ncbi:MAG: efflux RND transporter periplasmic adaptor subunit [Candidatus Acidiferrales bacterium]